MQNIRKQVLQTFKKLHRTRQVVFNNDVSALEAARQKINNDFKKNRNVENAQAVEELLKFAEEVDQELRRSVVQAQEIEPGRFQLNLRPEVTRMDNVPFNDCPSRASKQPSKPPAPCKG